MSSVRTDIAELLDNFDIESWLDAEGVEYKVTHGRSGTQLNVRCCPVCGNNKYKVYLNAETGLGSCFAGDHPPGENYNKVKFVQAQLGTASRRDAISAIEAFVVGSIWQPKREKATAVPQETKQVDMPASHPLPIDGRNLKYLTDRNIDLITAEHFGLRYCSKGRYEYLWQGKQSWQDYSGRILIPIYDFNGEPLTFQGRDITGTKDRKYLFPPMAATTGQTLYNVHRAREASRVVVGEGVFDVMAIWQAVRDDPTLGDMIPVCTFGKKLTSSGDGNDQVSQFIELRRMGLKEVTFMWDSEPQAILSALDAAAILRKFGLVTKIAILPAGLDPNEVASEVVRDRLQKAQLISLAVEARLRLQLASHAA